MAIRVVRNDAGNCVNFVGTSNPTYWNACLSAEIHETNPNNINIINDVRSSTAEETVYEFFNVPYTDFADEDGVAFENVQAAVDYITEKANVLGTDGGIDLNLLSVGFGLDATSTSIIMDNGFEYNVNSIKAVAAENGLIEIKPILGDRVLFKNINHQLVTDLNGVAISGGLQDVVNYLNELFTVGAFEQIVIADPYSTMVADVDGVVDLGSNIGSNVIDPIGDAIMGSSSSHYNRAGWKSATSIDQPGEYFTFDIRVTDSMGFGFLLDDGAVEYGVGSYGDPDTFCNDAYGNNAAYGYLWSHWFHSGNKGPWTYYGQNPSSSILSGWAGFGTSDERQNYIDDNPIKMKVGLDANGYMVVSYYDVSESTFVDIQRSSYKLQQGQSVKLGIKVYGTRGELYSQPKVHELEPAAPTMQFRYIESPDGNYEYPLFATEEEANYYDLNHSGTVGTGTSHTHTYADDPTNTTWYMPDTGRIMNGATPPQDAAHTVFMGNNVTYTEITSLTNADLTPPAFSGTNITQEEGTAVNIQINPQDVSYSTSVSISPSGSGLVYNSTSSTVQGTLADVGADTVYTITVTRANSYGSSTGSMTVTATDVAPVNTQTTPWTKALDFSGGSEYAREVTTQLDFNPLAMSGYGLTTSDPSQSGYTSPSTSARPWATACVFRIDGNNSNQHIWNAGEGAGSTDDNIYLRVDSAQNLYFGWGRSGALNEVRIITAMSSAFWYGVYVGHNGRRRPGSGATAGNLYQDFQIRYMTGHDNFGTLYSGGSYNDWNSATATTGGRQDRSVTGQFTIGGRAANRNFHGKVASMVCTTLKINSAMPTDAEITEMITDPQDWVTNYKIGNDYRISNGSQNFTNFQRQTTSYGTYPAGATQVWLMGDGESDSYANGIRNYIQPADQNNTKLQLNSMVSNDIETVNIGGLT